MTEEAVHRLELQSAHKIDQPRYDGERLKLVVQSAAQSSEVGSAPQPSATYSEPSKACQMVRMKGFLRAAMVLATTSLTAATASAQNNGLTAKYVACMDASGGVTFEMIKCIDAEYKRQDARLNKAYQTVMSDLSAERRQALRAAQRAWITFRDANCSFYFDPQGGSYARVAANECMMSETAERAFELEQITGFY